MFDGQHASRVGQDPGIGAIVLGQPSIGFRKHPDAVGVEADDLEAVRLKRVHHLDFIAAGGFQADLADAHVRGNQAANLSKQPASLRSMQQGCVNSGQSATSSQALLTSIPAAVINCAIFHSHTCNPVWVTLQLFGL